MTDGWITLQVWLPAKELWQEYCNYSGHLPRAFAAALARQRRLEYRDGKAARLVYHYCDPPTPGRAMGERRNAT